MDDMVEEYLDECHAALYWEDPIWHQELIDKGYEVLSAFDGMYPTEGKKTRDQIVEMIDKLADKLTVEECGA